MPSAYGRLPLGALRVFEAVASHLNFSAAAEALNVTPAAVSQQIKTLESYIQVSLVRRTGRLVEITEEGIELLPAVRAGLDKLESAVHMIKQHGRAGPLQITLFTSFLQIWLLPPRLLSPQAPRHRAALPHLVRIGGLLARRRARRHPLRARELSQSACREIAR